MKKRSGLAIILTAVMLLTAACGNSGATYREKSADVTAAEPMAAAGATNGIYMEEAAATADYEMMDEADGGSTGSSSPDIPATQATNRKLIRNISMEVETREFEALVEKVSQRTAFFGGYTEYSSTYNGSNYSGGRVRTSTMTLRIPADKMDEFLSEVAEVSNVVRRDENVSDVTLNYVDMESHKNALKAQEKRLIEMMDKAETIEDLITLESRLGDIRYQIESMESQLRTYDNLVDYSTLSLDITEVEDLTPVVEQSAWEKMGSGFMNSLSSIGRGFKNFGIGVVMNLPYILLWAVIILVIFLVSKAFIKKMIRKAGYGQKPAVNGTGTTAMAQASSGQLNATGTMETVAQEKALNQTEVTAPVQDNGKKDEKAPEGETTAEEKK
jgi:hypothetical protein